MTSALRRAGGLIYDRPYLLVTLTALFWAGNVVLARYIAGHVPPVAVSFMRWLVAFIILIPFAWPQLRRDWRALLAALPLMITLALTGSAAPNTMGFYGLQYTQALNALLIQSTGPLLIAFWVFVLFGEKLTLPQAMGLLLSLTGVVAIICKGSWETLRTVSFNIGDLWIVGALLTFGIYSALARKRPTVHPLSFLTCNVALASIMLVPLFAVEISTGYTMKFDALTVATIGFVAIFASLLAFLFFNRSVELIGPNRAAPFLHLMPLFGSALAIVLLGETPQLYHLAGYALILAGIVVSTRR